MEINLFLFKQYAHGGLAAYAKHLYRGLIQFGHTPRLFRVLARTERALRDYGEGIPYQNLSILDALTRANEPNTRSMILFANWNAFKDEVAALLDVVPFLVLHDPTHFHPEHTPGFIDFLKEQGIVPIVIRKQNVKVLEEYGLESLYLPHPYKATNPDVHQLGCAASISRISAEKGIEIIIETNQLLPKGKSIDLYGQESRIYMFRNLDPAYPSWRDNYQGPFPRKFGAAPRIASRYHHLIDLSNLRHLGDGGGTQYTFFEAWDAKSTLIVHKDWLFEDSAVQKDVNCLAVSTPQELKDALLSGKDHSHLLKAGRDVMKAHSLENTIPIYLRFLNV